MDNKRLFLAVVLSVCIFLGWNLLAVQLGWIKPAPEAPVASTAPNAPAAPATPESVAGFDTPAPQPAPPVAPTPGKLITVETPLYRAVLHSNGGILQEFHLKNYRDSQGQEGLVSLVSEAAAAKGPLGILLDGAPTWGAGAWTTDAQDVTLKGEDSKLLRFVGEVNGVRVVRDLIFSAGNYTISEKLQLDAPQPRVMKLGIMMAASHLAIEKSPSIWQQLKHRFLGGALPALEESQYNMTRVAWLQHESFSEASSLSDLKEGKLVVGQVAWAGIMNNYFLGAVSMHGADASLKASFADNVFQVILGKTDVAVGGQIAGQDAPKVTEVLCTYFVGPKVSSILSETPNGISRALDYGFFSIIAKPLVALLQFFYSYVGNYGVAIILMTILIKIVFWPLSQKSYKSMEQMKKLQPEMQKIREKYADDKEAMNKEIMQLYKTYKVNPAGGCLPIVVQIPVFFGLYQALLNAIELRHAVFVPYLPFTNIPWLTDLAAPDPFLITPLVMGATMFIQQKMSPPPGDPMQAKIMLFMPVVFTLLFINFPSGLVVYWLVNNIISIGQQRMLRPKA